MIIIYFAYNITILTTITMSELETTIDNQNNLQDLELKIKNIDKYKQIIPKELHILFDPTFNYSLYKSLNEKAYDTICKLPHNVISKIISTLQTSILFEDMELFNVFKMNFNKDLEIITSYNFVSEENIPFHIEIYEDNLICDFPDTCTLQNKLDKSKSRYISYELILKCLHSESSHSVLLVFDTKKYETYVIDTNGDLSYFDEDDVCQSSVFLPKSYYLHLFLTRYSELLGFKYNNISNVNTCINVKIKSKSQKKFFDGYCRGWTLFFQHITLVVQDNDFNFIQFIKKFCSKNKKILNEIVEIYQVYYLNLLDLDYL